jgi:hypothetical protein
VDKEQGGKVQMQYGDALMGIAVSCFIYSADRTNMAHFATLATS